MFLNDPVSTGLYLDRRRWYSIVVYSEAETTNNSIHPSRLREKKKKKKKELADLLNMYVQTDRQTSVACTMHAVIYILHRSCFSLFLSFFFHKAKRFSLTVKLKFPPKKPCIY